MKYLWTSLSLLALSRTVQATCYEPFVHSFYIKVGSGVSCSQSAHVTAPTPRWTPAIQGYNSSLGTYAIIDLGIGCELMDLVDLELSISDRSTFKYRKYQTPIIGGNSYRREFDLDVIPLLFSVNFLGKDLAYLNWNIACGQIYPIIGAGIGVSYLFITNFRTTGLPPSGSSYPLASFSNENQYTLRKNLTYTFQIGFEYIYDERWAVTTGYRWLDAGQFKGPRYQRVSTGGAVDVDGQEWKINFRSHEWFVDFKIFI